MQRSRRVKEVSRHSLHLSLALSCLACQEGPRRDALDSAPLAGTPQPAATQQAIAPTLTLPPDSALVVVSPDTLLVASGIAHRRIGRVDLDGLVGVHAQSRSRRGPFRLDTAHIIDHRRSGDSAFVLLTVAGFPSTTTVGSCDSTGRERFLLWVPLIQGRDTQPAPVTFRYGSCWYGSRTAGLTDSGGSVAVTAVFPHFAKRAVVTYDRTQPGRGIQVALSPIDAAAFNDSVTRQDSIDALEEERRSTPVPVLRNPAEMTWLPAAVRDTLAAHKCRVPQYVGDTTANIGKANLFGTGPDAWYVWCALTAGSRILVFRDGSAALAGNLQVQAASPPAPDAKYDPDAPRWMRYGCIGGVYTIAGGKELEERVRTGLLASGFATLSPEERSAPLHAGILDGECEGATVIHYWTGRRWVILPGGH